MADLLLAVTVWAALAILLGWLWVAARRHPPTERSTMIQARADPRPEWERQEDKGTILRGDGDPIEGIDLVWPDGRRQPVPLEDTPPPSSWGTQDRIRAAARYGQEHPDDH